jgi:hypothetical protein
MAWGAGATNDHCLSRDPGDQSHGSSCPTMFGKGEPATGRAPLGAASWAIPGEERPPHSAATSNRAKAASTSKRVGCHWAQGARMMESAMQIGETAQEGKISIAEGTDRSMGPHRL